jgi:hypothetical protein
MSEATTAALIAASGDVFGVEPHEVTPQICTWAFPRISLHVDTPGEPFGFWEEDPEHVWEAAGGKFDVARAELTSHTLIYALCLDGFDYWCDGENILLVRTRTGVTERVAMMRALVDALWSDNPMGEIRGIPAAEEAALRAYGAAMTTRTNPDYDEWWPKELSV